LAKQEEQVAKQNKQRLAALAKQEKQVAKQDKQRLAALAKKEKQRKAVASKNKQTKEQQNEVVDKAKAQKIQQKIQLLKEKNEAEVNARRKDAAALQQLVELINEKSSSGTWTVRRAVSLFLCCACGIVDLLIRCFDFFLSFH
jgi:rubrerythrin